MGRQPDTRLDSTLSSCVLLVPQVFTHMVGVQTLLSWDYEVTQAAVDTLTQLAQGELRNQGGYLVGVKPLSTKGP